MTLQKERWESKMIKFTQYTKLHEEASMRLKQLARMGLVDKKEYSRMISAMKKINQDKQLSVQERGVVVGMVNKLVDIITGDTAVFQKAKKAVSENLELFERAMSDSEKKKKEDIVMAMKKDTAGMKDRYGDRWKDVMYATATKKAMGEEVEQIDEISRDTARSYIRKASADNAERKKEVMKPFPMKQMGKNVEMHKKFKKREAGIEMAGKKAYGIGGKAKVNATESVELDEDISKMSDSRLKWHMNTGVPHGSYTKDEMKKERDRRLSRVDTHAAYKKAKPMLEEVELDEAVEVRHDRYMRSHGKKARDSGHSSGWFFTHKNMGHINNYDDPKEVHFHQGRFADAKKSAQKWAKKHGHSTVYVMEEVEQLDELSPNKLHAYIKGASKDLAKRSRMSGYDDKRGNYADGDKNRKRANKRMAGITSASGRLADKANQKEEVELDEKGLWDNIHAKRKRIKAGSGERMRKPGSKGAPTDADFKSAQESVEVNEISKEKAYKYWHKSYEDETERRGDIINRKSPPTSDEKRKIANRAAGRKLATARVLGKDGMEKAKAARARGKAGKKDKAVGSAVFKAFRQDRKKAKAEEK